MRRFIVVLCVVLCVFCTKTHAETITITTNRVVTLRICGMWDKPYDCIWKNGEARCVGKTECLPDAMPAPECALVRTRTGKRFANLKPGRLYSILDGFDEIAFIGWGVPMRKPKRMAFKSGLEVLVKSHVGLRIGSGGNQDR